MNSPEFDLMYCHRGNGITVANKSSVKDGDYETVAHITPQREVTFYTSLPVKVAIEISDYADLSSPMVSETQQVPVFTTQAGI